jgi:hypothetical protein
VQDYFDQLEVVVGREQSKDFNFKATVLEHKAALTSMLSSLSVNHKSIISPMRVHNFAYDRSIEGTKQSKPYLELSDAGIDFNLPFPPLLRPEREIDIIIACNSSKCPNINRSRCLYVSIFNVRGGFNIDILIFKYFWLSLVFNFFLIPVNSRKVLSGLRELAISFLLEITRKGLISMCRCGKMKTILIAL